MSSGIQKAVADGLRYILGRVEEGAYGEGDDAFQGPDEDDALGQAFLDDLHDEVLDKME